MPTAIRKRANPSESAARSASPSRRSNRIAVPTDVDNAEIRIGQRTVSLTNLRKPFWPKLGITKGDLLRYYATVAPVILPHLRDRAMVMKRYPNGETGPFFFMKRAPSPRPEWIDVCTIDHKSGNVIDFPVVNDVAALFWLVNLGCIDLNPWYARCDDVNRPDFLHFDLDPTPGGTFDLVRETALVVRGALEDLGMTCYATTTGSRGIHVYVPIVRGPTQKQVWSSTKQLAVALAAERPRLITAEYRVANRPKKHVLVDYNQNAWGRTLASVYSVRPKPLATVSAPVTWQEIERGIRIDDFRLDNMPARLVEIGDLWKPLLAARGRFRLPEGRDAA
ncbi:MAG TPA: non-homologous end-joining DNA ligase [Pirellulales bacterium]|nr:non-homologous end-joining DNA ligase [Pirellulales bacterium]